MHSFPIHDITPPISKIALGTGLFGSGLSAEDSDRLMDRFFEADGTLFDSAHIYAAWAKGGTGASERTLGSWVARRGVRDRVVIGTKGGHPYLDSMDVARMRPENLANDLVESLERLGMDCIDIYWLHRDDPAIPVGEILDALEEQRQKGRLKRTGASNWKPARLREADAHARRRGYAGFCGSQIDWSLALSEIPEAAGKGAVAMDDTTYKYHMETQLPVMAYSSQATGFFSQPDRSLRGRDTALNQARRRVAFQLAAQHGCSANAIALAWLMHAPFPTSAIVGCKTMEQLDDSLSAAKVRLTEEEMKSLTEGKAI